MILPIVVTALIQTAACVLCVGLGYQMGFREGEKIEREKHIEDDSPIGMRVLLNACTHCAKCVQYLFPCRRIGGEALFFKISCYTKALQFLQDCQQVCCTAGKMCR